MDQRFLSLCCIAICLLLAGLPPLSAAPAADAAAHPMPCEGKASSHGQHHPGCAQGCQSAPELPTAGPDWGPASNRSQAFEFPDLIAPPPDWRDTEPLRRTAGLLLAPRAPPPMAPESPVTRSDRLLD